MMLNRLDLAVAGVKDAFRKTTLFALQTMSQEQRLVVQHVAPLVILDEISRIRDEVKQRRQQRQVNGDQLAITVLLLSVVRGFTWGRFSRSRASRSSAL